MTDAKDHQAFSGEQSIVVVDEFVVSLGSSSRSASSSKQVMDVVTVFDRWRRRRAHSEESVTGSLEQSVDDCSSWMRDITKTSPTR